MGASDLKIAVVIPCFKVKDHILEVVAGIGPEVSTIYIVDDACPDGSGKFVQENSKDKRLKFIFHEENQGVGGAVISGYQAAMNSQVDVIVKIDGDGQISPKLISSIISPIAKGEADYVKGNRFSRVTDLKQMPPVRLVGNAGLSFMSKISSGYWSLSDPTNGFTAISKEAVTGLELEKLNKRYFFESDMLFRLGLQAAVIRELRMESKYGTEISNLNPLHALVEFPFRHGVNLIKRLLYRHFLREWTLVTFELPVSLVLLGLGGFIGVRSYIYSIGAGAPVTAGQITTAALLTIVGLQLFLSAVSHDLMSEPRSK